MSSEKVLLNYFKTNKKAKKKKKKKKNNNKNNPPSFYGCFSLGSVQVPFPRPEMCIYFAETLWPHAVVALNGKQA